ncbi:hypothetical protein ACVTKY_004534 [Klebsiella michiganensis]
MDNIVFFRKSGIPIEHMFSSKKWGENIPWELYGFEELIDRI